MSAEVKPGYKLTEVGVIPEEWKIVRIGDVTDIHIGRDLIEDRFSQFFDSTYKFPVYSNTVEEQGFYGFYSLPEYEGDSVTVVGRGVGLGRAFARLGGYGAIGRLLVLFPSSRVDARFLATYINQRVKIFIETGGIPQLTGSQIAKYNVVLPSISEQRAIAGALSDVDALLEGLERLITKKRNIKQAAMQQLLTGKTRLPGFSGEWEVKPFDDILIRVNAKTNQIQTIDYQITGVYPVIDQGKAAVIGFSDRADKLLKCPEGGVIVFGDHTCIVKFIDFDFLVGADGTQIIRARSGQSTRFHAFQLQYCGIEPTGYNRHFKFLKERSFLIPPTHEQTAIAALLSDMDTELAALEKRRDKTRNLKQAMMQELLTGKTRLI